MVGYVVLMDQKGSGQCRMAQASKPLPFSQMFIIGVGNNDRHFNWDNTIE